MIILKYITLLREGKEYKYLNSNMIILKLG